MAKFHINSSSPKRDEKGKKEDRSGEEQGMRLGDSEPRRTVFGAVNTVFKEPIFRLPPR